MSNDLLDLRHKAFRILDTATKNLVEVKITENYLSIGINERKYYFITEDGKYDGHSIDLTYRREQNLPSQVNAIF